ASRAALRQLVGHPGRLRAAGVATRAAQKLRLTSVARSGRMLPQLGAPFRAPAGGVAPAAGERKHRVAFLVGCVMPIMYPQSHHAAVRLLQLAGCEVWFPQGERCCGALFAHNGDIEGAERLRDANTRMYQAASFDALIVDSAGCGAHLKDFYPELKGRVKDLTEWLAQVGLPEPKREVRVRVTYQDACHLAHAQKIKKEPRDLIRTLPGVEWVEMRHAEICCGAAGLYSTLEPDMSNRILREKLDDAFGSAVEVPGLEQEAAHLLHADPGRLDPIAAQHNGVSLFELHLVGERLHLLPHANRARELVLLRMVRSLLRFDQPQADLLGRP